MNMNGWKNWFLENIKGVAIALIILVMALGAYGVKRDRDRVREQQARDLLFSVRKSVKTDVDTRQFEQVLSKVQPIFEEYPKTRAAFEAQLMIGDMWMDAGENEKAASAYAKGHEMSPDSFSGLLAKYNEALAMEQGKAFAKAENAYNEALSIKGSEFLKPEILMAKARCLEAQQRFDEARKLYIQLRDKFSDGFYGNAAAAFLGELPQ